MDTQLDDLKRELFNKARKWFTTASNWFTTDRIIAVFTIVLGIVATMQWWEMHSGSRDTHALAVAARQQATAATAQSKAAAAQTRFASKEVDALARQNDDLKKSLEKTDALIRQAVSQARATQRLAVEARRSADAADQAVLLNKRADRAWLELVISAPPNPHPGKQNGVSASYINVGKTPAHVFASDLAGTSGFFMSDEPAFGVSSDVVNSTTIVFPGQGGAIYASPESPITFTQWVNLTRNGTKLFIYAQLIYQSEGDTKLRSTHACITWNPPTKKWINCDTYNDAN
jgi:hypothetical protein